MTAAGTYAEAQGLVQEIQTLPDADPRDLGGDQATQIRAWLNADLYSFAVAIFQYQDLKPELHGEISDWISQWGNPGLRRIGVQISREFFKSSLCTRANALWQICREPDLPVIIFNERLENTAKWIRAIKDVIQGSKLFQAVYSDLLPPGISQTDRDLGRTMPRGWKWSDTEMNLQRGAIGIPEASLTGSGIEAATTGGHWPKLILDDLISLKHAQSETEMNHAREWIDTHTFLMRPAEEGLSLFVATPWKHKDIYDDLIGKFAYKVYRRSGLENGESIFPEKLSTEKLQEMQKRDPYVFSAQIQCRPRPSREISFAASWLRDGHAPVESFGEPAFVIDPSAYDPEITIIEDDVPPPRVVPLHWMDKALLVDPAPSEAGDLNRSRNARNALVLAAIDPYGRRYVLDVWVGKKEPIGTIQQMYTMCMKWQTHRVAVEAVAFSKLYRPFIRYVGDKDYGGYRLQPALVRPEGREKHYRIQSLIPHFRSGFFYLNTHCCDALIEEMMDYNPQVRGNTVDTLDALAYFDDVLRRPEAPSEMENSYWLRAGPGTPGSTADAVTGY